MADRINQGYVITDSIQIGEMEFVFGKLDSNTPMYVTWACKGGNDCFWGDYHSDLLSATKDLLDRAAQALDFCMRYDEKAQSPRKEPEETCL